MVSKHKRTIWYKNKALFFVHFSMGIISLQELAHCQEQILLLRNHQVLPCQAGEHWGKNSTTFYKKIHILKEEMFLCLGKCIGECMDSCFGTLSI